MKGLRTMTAPEIQPETSEWSAEEERMFELCYSAFTIKTLVRVWPEVAGKHRSLTSLDRKATRLSCCGIPDDVWEFCDE